MPVFSPASLTETTASIFAAAGMRADEACVVAELLVEANLVGHDFARRHSHPPSTWAKSKLATLCQTRLSKVVARGSDARRARRALGLWAGGDEPRRGHGLGEGAGHGHGRCFRPPSQSRRSPRQLRGTDCRGDCYCPDVRQWRAGLSHGSVGRARSAARDQSNRHGVSVAQRPRQSFST